MNKEECVLTLTNKGYIKYTKNLINSINKNNIDLNLFIYTMDQHSFNYFKKLNENVFLIEGLNTKKFLKQNSPEFGNYMLEKIKIIHQALQTFESVIYLDGDIVIKKNFLNHLSHYEKDYDLLIQDDKNPKKPHIEYLCAGFMKINSNTKTVNFFDSKNISKEMIMTGLHDQQYINENKKTSLYEQSSVLLSRIYNTLSSEKNVKITPAPSWRVLEDYGGNMNIDRFRESFNRVDFILHGTCDNTMYKPLGHVVEQKLKF